MSDFAEFESVPNNVNNGEDPVAAFLAREKEELDRIENDNFDTFSSNNQIQNNGFGDDFGLNNQTSNIENYGSEENINDDYSNQNSNSNAVYSAISQADRFAQEPEKIKKWRDEQRERLTKKDAEEDQKKKEWKEIAKKELEDWYKNRQEQLEKTHAANKVNNKAAEAELMAQRDSLTSGQEWERVAKLCDFNPKANKNTRDVSRMRSILLQLKQQPLIRNAN